jgi:sec-independent protein translocase protein TatB
MLGLSWTEMLIIGVVALIFIGPKDLPVVMNRVGKVVGQIQRMGRDFQREINKSTGLDEVRNLRTSITAPLKQSAEEIRREFNSIGKDGKVSPSGVIKPTDPKVESVADEIRAKAGMPPAAKPIPPAPAATSAQLAAEPVVTPSAEPPPPEPAPAAKPAPVKAARPRASAAADVVASPSRPAVAKAASAKAKPAPRARKAAAPVIDAEGAPVPAPKKPRAPRKKPAAEAENN